MIRRAPRPLPLVIAAAAIAAAGCTKAQEHGRQLYAERGCAVCHGAAGRGDGPSARRLDLPPRDFANVRGYRQGSSQADIAASIRQGSGPNNAMPAFRDITESEANDIAAWIVSLSGARGIRRAAVTARACGSCRDARSSAAHWRWRCWRWPAAGASRPPASATARRPTSAAISP